MRLSQGRDGYDAPCGGHEVVFYRASNSPRPKLIWEDMMRLIIPAIVAVVSLGALVTTSANALPMAPAAPIASGVDQARWVCNEWGRCWWRQDYHRRYGYYGYGGYDRPRYRYGYGYYGRPHYWGGYGYGGWHRRWDDDD